jgi:hypothetical protein
MSSFYLMLYQNMSLLWFLSLKWPLINPYSLLINHLSGVSVGQDFISVAPRRELVTRITRATVTGRTLGKGLLPRSYDCLIFLSLGKSLLPKLIFVCGKSHVQFLLYVSPHKHNCSPVIMKGWKVPELPSSSSHWSTSELTLVNWGTPSPWTVVPLFFSNV